LPRSGPVWHNASNPSARVSAACRAFVGVPALAGLGPRPQGRPGPAKAGTPTRSPRGRRRAHGGPLGPHAEREDNIEDGPTSATAGAPPAPRPCPPAAGPRTPSTGPAAGARTAIDKRAAPAG